MWECSALLSVHIKPYLNYLWMFDIFVVLHSNCYVNILILLYWRSYFNNLVSDTWRILLMLLMLWYHIYLHWLLNYMEFDKNLTWLIFYSSWLKAKRMFWPYSLYVSFFVRPLWTFDLPGCWSLDRDVDGELQPGAELEIRDLQRIESPDFGTSLHMHTPPTVRWEWLFHSVHFHVFYLSFLSLQHCCFSKMLYFLKIYGSISKTVDRWPNYRVSYNPDSKE